MKCTQNENDILRNKSNDIICIADLEERAQRTHVPEREEKLIINHHTLKRDPMEEIWFYLMFRLNRRRIVELVHGVEVWNLCLKVVVIGSVITNHIHKISRCCSWEAPSGRVWESSESRPKVLKPLEVLASSGAQPTLFQKRAAMCQSSGSKMGNSESSGMMEIWMRLGLRFQGSTTGDVHRKVLDCLSNRCKHLIHLN
ncbi:hypothetical protein F2Q70_00038083 [Brassica cretica]|uniref:Uncharacterized protein n=1 Tax=Brassica cretica TaxID=69181 RepID=A0A8S9K596_BRACR|nr:hypothetical protein F2Q70_00038083 [Brassica cretica]